MINEKTLKYRVELWQHWESERYIARRRQKKIKMWYMSMSQNAHWVMPQDICLCPHHEFCPQDEKKIKRKDPKILRVQKISPPKIIGKGEEKTMIWWCLISAASAASLQQVQHLCCSLCSYTGTWFHAAVADALQLVLHLWIWCCISAAGDALSLQLVMLLLCS